MSRMFEDRVPQMSGNQEIVRSALDLFVKDLGPRRRSWQSQQSGDINCPPDISLLRLLQDWASKTIARSSRFFRSLPPQNHTSDKNRCESGPILLCMGLFSRFLCPGLRCHRP